MPENEAMREMGADPERAESTTSNPAPAETDDTMYVVVNQVDLSDPTVGDGETVQTTPVSADEIPGRALEQAKVELELAKTELQKARAELDRGNAEVEHARRELHKSKIALEQAKAELEEAKADLMGAMYVEMNVIDPDDPTVGDIPTFRTTPLTPEELDFLRDANLRKGQREFARGVLYIAGIVVVGILVLLGLGVITVQDACVIIGATGINVILNHYFPNNRKD